jgi:hypothetical protein
MTTPTGRRIARPRLGDPALDQAVLDLVDAAAIEHDRDLVIEMVASVLKLGRGGNNRGDMKLASTASARVAHVVCVVQSVPRLPQVLGVRLRPDSTRRTRVRGGEPDGRGAGEA